MEQATGNPVSVATGTTTPTPNTLSLPIIHINRALLSQFNTLFFFFAENPSAEPPTILPREKSWNDDVHFAHTGQKKKSNRLNFIIPFATLLNFIPFSYISFNFIKQWLGLNQS